MELSPEDIKLKRLVGKTPNGYPIYHILTKGGFNAILRKLPDGAGWHTLGQGHPFAVARHMADQVEKNIIWDESLNKTEDFNIPVLEKKEYLYESNPETHYKLAAHHSKLAGKVKHEKDNNEKRLNEFHENIAYPHYMQEKNAKVAGIKRMPDSYKMARKIIEGLKNKLESNRHNLSMKNLIHTDTALKHFKASGLSPQQALEEHEKHMALHHELKDNDDQPYEALDPVALEFAWHKKHLDEEFPKGIEPPLPHTYD